MSINYHLHLYLHSRLCLLELEEHQYIYGLALEKFYADFTQEIDEEKVRNTKEEQNNLTNNEQNGELTIKITKLEKDVERLQNLLLVSNTTLFKLIV